MQHNFWYALPLLVSISLVYAATRHESPRDILHGALKIGTWFGGFLGVAMLVVYLLDLWAF